MYTKEDAERDLLDIFYKLDLDEVTGKKPEAALIDQFEKTELPNHLEHWWGIRNGTLIVAMWAMNYRLGVQYVAANLASVSVRDSKQQPVINRLKLFSIGMLLIPYVLLILGAVTIALVGVLGFIVSLLGVSIYLYGGWYAHLHIREARQKLIQILHGLELDYSTNQIDEYSNILRDDYLICYLCGGMNFFFQVLLVTMILLTI